MRKSLLPSPGKRRTRLLAYGFWVASLVASPSVASAQSVLWWTDYIRPSNVIPGSLSGTGYSVTQATSASEFSGALTSGVWDLVILGLHSGGIGDTGVRNAVTSYVTGGGRMIGANWQNSWFTQLLGASVLSLNPSSISLGDHAIGTGLGSSVGLHNPGWGTYAQGYTAAAGAECIGSVSTGGCAAVVGNSGRTMMLSPLFDSYADQAQGELLVRNSAAHLLGEQTTVTPEPVSMALLGTGLAGLGAVRRRRRQQAETA